MSAEQSVTIVLEGRTYHAFFLNGCLRSVLLDTKVKNRYEIVTRTLYAFEWGKPLKGRPLQICRMAQEQLEKRG